MSPCNIYVNRKPKTTLHNGCLQNPLQCDGSTGGRALSPNTDTRIGFRTVHLHNHSSMAVFVHCYTARVRYFGARFTSKSVTP